MTCDEKNDIDVRRVMQKRGIALRHLDDFKKWNHVGLNQHSMIIIIGLTRDILRGTEDELDDLIDSLSERNQTALMESLQK
jgi:hypothetical protein